jgi:hypothetical protein
MSISLTDGICYADLPTERQKRRRWERTSLPFGPFARTYREEDQAWDAFCW